MIFKSYILENNLQTIENCKIFLFYGENQGLKKDFKEKLKSIYKKNDLLNFIQTDIIKNKEILLNEVSNKSLFNERKIIFIDQVNDKILDNFEELINQITTERIFLFADILDKKSKLRNLFEKNKNLGIVPCYLDNETSIRKIIVEGLKTNKGLSNQIINIIVQNTGFDRYKVNNEVKKIISYFGVNGELNLEKIEALLNIRSNDDFSSLRDEAMKGNKINTNRLLSDTVLEMEHNIYNLNSINQRFYKLKEIESLKDSNSSIETIISNLRPPIFWKDKTTIMEQSKKWNKNKIDKALKETYKTEVMIKSNSTIKKDLLLKKLIVDLCNTANSS